MIQIILQDYCRSCRIKARLALLPVALANSQPAFGFAARQSLVSGDDLDRRAPAQRGHKVGDVRRLLVRRPVEPHREPDNDAGETVVFTGDAIDFRGDQIDAASGLDRNRLERRRERTGRVADRKADAPAADVDA